MYFNRAWIWLRKKTEWRLKLAQTLDKLGRRDWAMGEFLHSAQGFSETENWDAAREAIDRSSQIFPATPRSIKVVSGDAHRQRTIAAGARRLQKSRRESHRKSAALPGRGNPSKKWGQLEPDSLATLQLHAELYQSTGDTEQLIDALHKLSLEHVRRESYGCRNRVRDFDPGIIHRITSRLSRR